VFDAKAFERSLQCALGDPGGLGVRLDLGALAPLAVCQLVGEPFHRDLAVRPLILAACGEKIIGVRVAVPQDRQAGRFDPSRLIIEHARLDAAGKCRARPRRRARP